VEGQVGQIDVFLTDGRKFRAKLIRDFPDQDLAVLSIKGANLPFLEIGSSSSVLPGQTVLAIGNPFGDQLAGGLSYSEPTVTRGIISATKRNLTVPTDTGDVRYLRNMLQTDAAINQGNSGGALIDLNGMLIGVNTAILSADGRVSVGIGFAIPSDRVKLVLEHVRKNKSVGQWYTGISVQNLTGEIARAVGFKGDGGAVITKVENGSPAEKSGLKPGDIIIRVNGFTVRSKDELFSMFRGSVPDEAFKLVLFRGRKTFGVDLKLGSK
jgi:S1-C subfamily serine protease